MGEDAEELEYIQKDPVKRNQSNIGSSYFLAHEGLPGEVLKNRHDEETSVTVAPGEGQIPANILRERHPFVLHFPCLFPDGRGGLHDEKRKIKITPQQFLLQRIQNINPVFAQNKPFVFSAVHYVEKYQLQSKVNISYMRGKVSLTSEGKSFLKTEDGFSVFDNIRGSPRYWQKLRYDLVAKLEQLGPFQFFYTLSCADKRWDKNIATLIMKNCRNLKVMHFMEEIGNNENFLDDPVKKANSKEDEGYVDEDELNSDEEDVEIIQTIGEEQEDSDSDLAEENKAESEYWIHEKVSSGPLNKDEECHLHKFNDGFLCRRFNLAEFPVDEKRKLLEENVLDVTRNFNRRVQSFRKNILMAHKSPLKIQFFQDRTEMQSRGFAHIHGCAWSDFKELEETHPGLKLSFMKLKQNKRLSNKDKKVLANFVNKTVTCSLSVKKIRKFGISKKRAIKILNMVKDVNVHSHTKTCRKYSTDCRFLFPRYPSYFTIIAQEQPAELLDEERANFWTNIDLVLE